MSKRDDLKIDIMSSIDDDIIEKHTKKRFDLLSGKGFGRKRKTLAAIIALAACLAMLASFIVVILPLIPAGQIPVYQGMTVSNEAPNVTVKAPRPIISRLSSTAVESSAVTESTTEVVTELPENIPTIEGSDRALYYARANEDIYITIHITNPDQYEILSFTLNDVKYQSYMFEPGSDSETLILKLNVGDVQGLVDYTIDAIKYVDGTEIKDVIMDGEKTVKVAVYPEEQPTAEIGEITCDLFEISLSAGISDPLSLVKDSNGTVSALLYDGDKLVSEKPLSVGQEKDLCFDGLDTGRNYILRIVAYYDALDGVGFTAHLLAEAKVTTQSLVEVTDVSYSDGKAIFDFNIVEGYGVTVGKTELISVDGKVIGSAEGSTNEIEQNYCYAFISITYSYDSDSGRINTTWMSPEPISIGTLNLSKTLSSGQITRKYSAMPVWNDSTQDYRSHLGIDYEPKGWGLPLYDPCIYATLPGIVTDVCWDGQYGNTIIITSFDGSLEIWYQGVRGIKVEKGDIVNGGEVLAKASSELIELGQDHVHIAVYENGVLINPEKYFN